MMMQLVMQEYHHDGRVKRKTASDWMKFTVEPHIGYPIWAQEVATENRRK